MIYRYKGTLGEPTDNIITKNNESPWIPGSGSKNMQTFLGCQPILRGFIIPIAQMTEQAMEAALCSSLSL